MADDPVSIEQREELERYFAIATRAAARVSKDEQVIGEAAGHAAAQFLAHRDRISAGERERKKWVEVVSANHAKRAGAKLHHDLAMGRAGSVPPPMHDPQADLHVQRLIGEIHLGGGSLGSMVATKVAFEERWALLSGEARSLLHAKHVEGLTLKEIAQQRGRGESTSQIDHKLRTVRETAAVVFADLLDELRGQYPDDLEDG